MKAFAIRALCWLLGGLFVYAGALKAVDPTAFAVDIYHYQLLPAAAATALALYLPYLEILAGLGVITQKFRCGALLLLLAMVVVFVIAIASAWARGLDITCGCFGTRDATANYPWLLFRDLAILGATAFLLRRELGLAAAGN